MTISPRNKLLFIIALSLAVVWFAPTPEAGSRMQASVSFAKGQVTLPTNPPTNIAVDVALDERAWSQGMMFRKDWGDIQGMLFVFPDERPRSFWMQNTYLPLDIIYLDSEFRIVHIAPDAKPLDATNIPSYKPAMAVLEIPAGKAKDYGLQVGDVLEWK
jgi:uncharacterized membrane protein (UPF0127 family)